MKFIHKFQQNSDILKTKEKIFFEHYKRINI